MPEENNSIKNYALEDFKLKPISSAETINQKFIINENTEDFLPLDVAPESLENKAAIQKSEAEEPAVEDPIFKQLAAPKLPELAKQDRARLQMQSPNRVHFYWSFKQNPFQTLNRVVGSQSNYQLIVKLVNQTKDREELFPVEAEGSAWFDVEADSVYRAEIGFYAVGRPFVRLLFSNSLPTPRKNPSPRRDFSANFAVTANQFAEVLDVSGFQQDAFEVALAGDDIQTADTAAQTAFSQIIGDRKTDYDEHQSSEIRFILLALASGHALEDLRGQISSSLFAVLQSNAEKLNAEKAFAALQENFDVFGDEIVEEESLPTTVFGASLINFPRFSKRRVLPKFSPVSSFRPTT
ncbi:MAG: DUF4912 domain-containing protein [Pyrinomonadaceae bacterium]|nr:DUF4912 domain-containing protein [Pyrinomonadaceae bacterium]